MLVNTTGINRRALKKAVPPFLLLFIPTFSRGDVGALTLYTGVRNRRI